MSKKNKCPKCKSSETLTEKFKDANIIIATRTKCLKCGKIKFAEEYGKIYYLDWKKTEDTIIKLNWIQRLKNKVQHKLRRRKR